MAYVHIEKTEDKKIVIQIEHRKLKFNENNVRIHENDFDDFELRFYDDKGVCFPYRIAFNFNTIRGYIDKREIGIYKNVRMFLQEENKEAVKNVAQLFRPFEFKLTVPDGFVENVCESLKKKATHSWTEPTDWDTDNNMCISVSEIYSLAEAPAGVLYG